MSWVARLEPNDEFGKTIEVRRGLGFMWQINFCPKCGARAAGSDRFCGVCGLNLTCVVRPVPPPSYDYHCTYQQWVPHSPPSNQAAAPINSEKYQQRYVYTDDGTVTPISAEISKLLADLFDKRLKHNKA